MLALYVRIRLLLSERGQTTAEYALVILAAAAVAVVLIAWARSSGKLPSFFDGVIDRGAGRAPEAPTAPDAAALAAAQELALPSGADPAEVASEYALRNGATMRSCDCAPGVFEASVSVEGSVGAPLVVPAARAVVAHARAVVELPSG